MCNDTIDNPNSSYKCNAMKYIYIYILLWELVYLVGCNFDIIYVLDFHIVMSRRDVLLPKLLTFSLHNIICKNTLAFVY